MSAACQAIDSGYFWDAYTNTGVSEDAERVHDAINGTRSDLQLTITIGEPRKRLKKELLEAFEESRESNWDGYGAREVSFIEYLAALRFVEKLPTSLPIPEVIVEPDGEIAFEWHKGISNIFSISIGRDNRLVYAGIIGDRRVHGEEYLKHEIPNLMIDFISDLLLQAG